MNKPGTPGTNRSVGEFVPMMLLARRAEPAGFELKIFLYLESLRRFVFAATKFAS